MAAEAEIRTRRLPHRFDVVTFDCYGTLIDWDDGIFRALSAGAARDGLTLDRRQVLRLYEETERAVEEERYRTYREILARTASRVAERVGWALSEERASFLADSLPSWPPFADTNPALVRLFSAGVRLGILSNVDDDLLAGTRRQLEVPFEVVVTAEQVRSYKPGRAHFEAARERIGSNARWLHAAQSYFHDVAPARGLGIPVAWINRKRQRAGAEGAPDAEFPTLSELADWILAPGEKPSGERIVSGA